MAERLEENQERSWERPWTTEEMRENAGNWSLAGDAGLLRHLQEFSQTLISRTHATTRSIDALFERLDQVGTDIENSTNAFLSLSNTQFVENRVYEDDDKETPTEENSDKDKALDGSKDKEKDKDEMVARIREALHRGLEVMDTRYTIVQVPNSDTEEEDENSNSTRTVLKAINPYLHRPLPHRIGSEAFMKDSDIGLAIHDTPTHSDSDSDIEAEKSLNGNESSGSENERKDASDSPSNSPVDQSGDMFGNDSPQLVQSTPRSQQPSFAEQLAHKLGGVASSPADQSDDMFSPVDQSDDMFSPQGDDSLFGKFSGGRGLFGDLDQEEKSATKDTENLFASNDDAIFSTKPKAAEAVAANEKSGTSGSANRSASKSSAKDSASGDIFGATDDADDLWNPGKKAAASGKMDSLFGSANQDEDDLFSTNSKPPSSSKVGQSQGTADRDFKKPAGGVSIFGADFFPTSDKLQVSKRLLSSGENDSKETSTKPVDRRLLSVEGQAIAGPTFTSTPENDEGKNDPSDLSPITHPTASLDVSTTKSLSLFDDVDEEDDLFAVPSVSNVSNSLNVSNVSTFGNSTAQSFDSSVENESNDAGHNVASSSGNSSIHYLTSSISVDKLLTSSDMENVANSTKVSPGFTMGHDEDSLLQPKLKQPKLETPKATNQKALSLFDDADDDDLLFSSGSSPGSNIQPLNKSLFDRSDTNLFVDADYDLFAPSKPNTDLFAATKPNTDLFGSTKTNADLFGNTKPDVDLFKPNKPDSDLFPAKKPITEADDDDLFSPKKQDVDIFALKPAARGPFDTKEQAPATQDSFSIPGQDLFGSPEPVSSRIREELEGECRTGRKPEPPRSLNIRQQVDLFNWNEESDEDLFGLPSKPKPQPKGEETVTTEVKPTTINKVEKKDSAVTTADQCKNLSGDESKKPKPEIPKAKPGSKPSVAPREKVTSQTTPASSEIKPSKVVLEKEQENIAREGAKEVRKVTEKEKKGLEKEKKPSDKEEKDVKIVGKIKSPVGLVIDPRALLPGSKPSKPAQMEVPAETETQKSTPEAAVGSAVVPTLHSVAKERARIVAKRRPQSRKARLEAVRTSVLFPDVDQSPPLLEQAPPLLAQTPPLLAQTPPLLEPSSRAPLTAASRTVPLDVPRRPRVSFASPVSMTPPPLTVSPGSNLLSPSTDEEDLFGVPQDPYLDDSLFPGEKPGLFSKPEPSANLFSDNAFDPKDTPETIPKHRSEIPGVSKMSPPVLEGEKVAEPAKATKVEDILGAPDKVTTDDLFNVKSIKDKDVSGDDLFGKVDSKDLFGSSSKDDDLFGSKGSNIRSKDLFGISSKDDGLFGAKPKETVKEKDLFDVSKKDKDIFDVSKKNKDVFDVGKKDKDVFDVSKKDVDVFDVSKKDKDLFEVSKKDKDVFEVGKMDKDPFGVQVKGDDLFGKTSSFRDQGLFETSTKDEVLFGPKAKDSASALDDDLFKVEEKIEDIFRETKPKKQTRKIESIFGGDEAADEGLFAVVKTEKAVEKTTKKPAKPEMKSLFGDDDDDDIFSRPSTASSGSSGKKTPQKKSTVAKPAKTSDAFHDPLMGGQDED